MKLGSVLIAVALGAWVQQTPHDGRGDAAPLTAPAMKALQIQVMLDRAGFSPGEIDAAMGSNTNSALAAYEHNGGDRNALPQHPLVAYRITDDDVAGPFTPEIPDDLAQQATLPALGYRDVTEMLGERFHCSPALLRLVNQHAQFKAGDEILVPDVPRDFDPTRPQPKESRASNEQGRDVTITVSKHASTIVVADQDGKTLFFAPVTTGSEHDPLPIGNWKVTGVQHDPVFHYNPELFWDADPTNSKAVIKAGPNNPVGVVWIDLDRPHYGIHGTPEPTLIGKTTSHGCVRLTNWDALAVASFARPGTRVVFAE